MNALFLIDNTPFEGVIDNNKLCDNLINGIAFASVNVFSGEEPLVISALDTDINTDCKKGKLFYRASFDVDFKENTALTKLSVGDVIVVEPDLTLSGIVNITFVISASFTGDILPTAGDNSFIEALFGVSPLGRLTYKLSDFGFANLPADRSVYPDTDESLPLSLKNVDGNLVFELLLSSGNELVIENDGKPVLRASLKDAVPARGYSSGICSSSGAFYVGDEIVSVIELKAGYTLCDDAFVLRTVDQAYRGHTLEKGKASILGEPSGKFALSDIENKLTLYEAGEGFPKVVRCVECEDNFALCSDGTVAAFCEDMWNFYFPDGTEARYNIPKGDEAVLVIESDCYHLAIKDGKYLMRFKVNMSDRSIDLISLIKGEDIGLFRAAKDAIGYRDGHLVAVVTTDSYREFEYPFSGRPDDFAFRSDCGYYASSGQSGNYRFGTEFDLACDFIGCNGLACVENNLYSLGKEAVSLGKGVSSAAVVGDYIIAAEDDAVVLYYAVFKGGFVVSEKAANSAYALSFEKRQPLDVGSNLMITMRLYDNFVGD